MTRRTQDIVVIVLLVIIIGIVGLLFIGTSIPNTLGGPIGSQLP